MNTNTSGGQFATINRYADLAGTQLAVATTYDYDPLGRLQQLAHTQGTRNLATYGYSYDARGNIAGIDYSSYQFAVDANHDYDYDATGQITGETHTDQEDHQYAFDDNGNRTSVTDGTTQRQWTIGANNQVLSDGTYNYTYDGEGNMSRRTSIVTGDYTQYSWGNNKELLSVENFTSTGTLTMSVHYGYDAFLQLVRREYDADGAGTGLAAKTWFVYDGHQIVLQFDQAAEENAEVELTHRYIWGPQVDQLLADEVMADLADG